MSWRNLLLRLGCVSVFLLVFQSELFHSLVRILAQGGALLRQFLLGIVSVMKRLCDEFSGMLPIEAVKYLADPGASAVAWHSSSAKHGTDAYVCSLLCILWKDAGSGAALLGNMLVRLKQ
jgi:hypothetical protein